MDKDTVTALKWVSPLLILLLLTASLLTTCHPIIGLFPESSFVLSEDSRLPKWFEVPKPYSRKDVTVEIHYFINLFGTNFKAILIGPEHKKLDRETGTQRWHPETLEIIKTKEGRNSRPHYVIAEINGIEEIIEHREKDNIFYITDNQLIIRE